MGGAPPRNYAGHDLSCPYEDIGDEEPGLKPNSFFAQCFAGLPFGRLRVKSPALAPEEGSFDCARWRATLRMTGGGGAPARLTRGAERDIVTPH